MKKKLASISTFALLSVGVVAALTLSNPEIRSQTIFATARDKQLAWLKEHEEEIVKWMHSVYPKVESVQFDWDTLRVGQVGNGVAIVEYNLSVKENLIIILILLFILILVLISQIVFHP